MITKVKQNIAYATRFSPRPGTPAAKAKGQVPSWMSKERSREMTKLRFEIAAEHYRKFVGQEKSILVLEKGKGSTLIGRTDEYVPVVIPCAGTELGQRLVVEIIDHASTHLTGRVL